MTIKLKSILPFFILLVLALSSCKKEDLVKEPETYAEYKWAYSTSGGELGLFSHIANNEYNLKVYRSGLVEGFMNDELTFEDTIFMWGGLKNVIAFADFPILSRDELFGTSNGANYFYSAEYAPDCSVLESFVGTYHGTVRDKIFGNSQLSDTSYSDVIVAEAFSSSFPCVLSIEGACSSYALIDEQGQLQANNRLVELTPDGQIEYYYCLIDLFGVCTQNDWRFTGQR